MKDFKYCIWYIPENTHPWFFYTNGFCPHLSIKTGLTYSEALFLFSKIKKQETHIDLDYIQCNEDEDFHSLYYTVKDPLPKPEWWPKNAHISFLYKYNKKITHIEAYHLHNYMSIKKGILKNFCIVKCKGHYSKWKMLLYK